MKKIALFTAVLVTMITACDNQEEIVINKDSLTNYKMVSASVATRLFNEEDEKIEETITFKYKGITYTSECQYGDELQIYNEEVSNVFKELNKKHNIAIAVNPDGGIEFYDSYTELETELQLKQFTVQTRDVDFRYIREFEIKLYEHAKGRTKGGRYLGFFSNGEQGNKSPYLLRVSESVMTSENFNNILSSIQMWGTVDNGGMVGQLSGQYKRTSVTFYDGNFTGKSLTFTDITVDKTYSERDYFSSFDFNDITSSFEVNLKSATYRV